MGHLSLIVKPTRLCNLRCSYCHDWREGPNQTMSFPVMAKMIASALGDRDHDSVEFIWHGGEPTMLPFSFYEKAMMVQSHFRRQGQVIVNMIQTNGTKLSEQWARFLRDSQFGVSISLDGPPEIHDQYRRYSSGRPSFDDVSASMNILKEYGIPFSVLMVIDENALRIGPKQIFDFFLKMGIKKYGLLAATPLNQPHALPHTPTTHYVNPNRMTEFLVELYDLWMSHGDISIKIREFEGILQRITRGRSRYCILEGGCFGQYYVVEPNGDVAHCELFQGDLRYAVGNILKDDFEVFRNCAKMTDLVEANEKDIGIMRSSCPEFETCNGWCPHERYLSARHNPNHIDSCCGLRGLITHIRNNLPKSTS